MRRRPPGGAAAGEADPSRSAFSSRMHPDGREAAGYLHRLARLSVQLLCDAYRSRVHRVDQRDQAFDLSLVIGPLSHRARGLGRIAVAPVLASDRPAEL